MNNNNVAVDLDLDGTMLSTTKGTHSIDLSSMLSSVVIHQAYIENIGGGDATGGRFLKKKSSSKSSSSSSSSEDAPSAIVVNYGLPGITSGWTIVKTSNLVGISVTSRFK